MKKKYLFIAMAMLLFFVLILSKKNETKVPEIIDETSTEFSNEQKVTITGYDGDANEPYISRDGKYLFFNNVRGENGKDLFYAEKIDNLTFAFKGEIQGVNTPYVDGNPTMDANNNFYFITTRDLRPGDDFYKTIYTGVFENGALKNLKKVPGTINVEKKMWINMGVEITSDGNMMYTSNAKFKVGSDFPLEGDIRYALKEGEKFNIPQKEQEILKNINTNYAIEYAGEASNDGLELFYSQAILSRPPQFKLYHAKRSNSDEPFGKPKFIAEPFSKDKNAFVEAPTLSADEKRLYYHKLSNGKFSIFMLSRN